MVAMTEGLESDCFLFLVLFFSLVTQSIYSRPSLFDGTLPLSTVDDAIGIKPPGFWLNVQVSVPIFSFFLRNERDV